MTDRPLADRDFDRLVHEGANVIVGSFRAAPTHPRFTDSGPTAHHLFVFPRTGVSIQHEGAPPFVAGPPVVTFYNRGQVYRRGPISVEGDRCEWFALSPVLLSGIVPGRPDVAAGEPPFPWSHGPSTADVYARQRRFVEACRAGLAPDPLAAEEEAVALARRVVTSAAAVWACGRLVTPPGRRAADRDLVEDAKALLLRQFREPLTLVDIAHALGCTPFHLCRVFRRATGWSLHQFRAQVRLRVALDDVRDRPGDLTGVALDLGYSSHSHFTAAFTRAFGVAPTQWQRLGALARAVPGLPPAPPRR